MRGQLGDWRVEGDGRIVSLDARGTLTGAVVRLDDLLTMMRRCWGNSGGPFGCSINPRRQALAAAQAYLAASASRPVQPGKRSEWLKGLRDAVGQQDIELFGVDPSSRVAGVLVEADHHMKLIGMGLEEGPPGVESYLERLATSRRSPAQSSGVLRWWFAMNYQAVRASPQADAFELVGPGAKVMSETEMLTVRGGRVPAGHADEFAEQFAADFSRHFGTLCQKYPVYSELRNVFDLAMVMEIAQQVREHDPRQWQPRLFLDARRLPLPQYMPAKHVETVVNHRVVNRRRFVAGVSGGVWSDPRSVLKERQEPTERTGYGPMGEQPVTLPEMIPSTAWWWDADPPASRSLTFRRSADRLGFPALGWRLRQPGLQGERGRGPSASAASSSSTSSSQVVQGGLHATVEETNQQGDHHHGNHDDGKDILRLADEFFDGLTRSSSRAQTPGLRRSRRR